MAHPQGGSSSTLSLVELEFENVDFCGGSREDEVRLVTHPTYMCVCVGGGGGVQNGSTWRKPFGAWTKTNDKLKPCMNAFHWWEASTLITAPSLFS